VEKSFVLGTKTIIVHWTEMCEKEETLVDQQKSLKQACKVVLNKLDTGGKGIMAVRNSSLIHTKKKKKEKLSSIVKCS